MQRVTPPARLSLVPSRRRCGNLGILLSATVVRALTPAMLLLLDSTEPVLKAFWVLLVAT